jgi:hypothetical protein
VIKERNEGENGSLTLLLFRYEIRCKTRFCFPLRVIHFGVAMFCELITVGIILGVASGTWELIKKNTIIPALVSPAELPQLRRDAESVEEKWRLRKSGCEALQNQIDTSRRESSYGRKIVYPHYFIREI